MYIYIYTSQYLTLLFMSDPPQQIEAPLFQRHHAGDQGGREVSQAWAPLWRCEKTHGEMRKTTGKPMKNTGKAMKTTGKPMNNHLEMEGVPLLW